MHLDRVECQGGSALKASQAFPGRVELQELQDQQVLLELPGQVEYPEIQADQDLWGLQVTLVRQDLLDQWDHQVYLAPLEESDPGDQPDLLVHKVLPESLVSPDQLARQDLRAHLVARAIPEV